MIQINNLTFGYDPTESSVLENLSLSLKEGEYVAIIGPNGCGKTTLIRHLNALVLPLTGEVMVDNLNTRDLKNHLEIRRRVGMVFQNPDNQIVGMTVEEDVAFGPGNLALPAEEIRRRVDQALSIVGMNGFQKRSPHNLSGGQKQLLALAGLLAMAPKYIVVDEPTSSLDPLANTQVLDLLQKLKAQGLGIVHVTHSMEEAAQADRVMVMEQGKIIMDGHPADILSQVERLKKLGMAPPKLTELMWLLRQNGADVSTNVLDLQSALNELTGLISRLKNPSDACSPRKVG